MFALEEYESVAQAHKYTPVNEETRTHSSPARHSLVSPIVHAPSAAASPYLGQQPQYVYIHAQPEQKAQQTDESHSQSQQVAAGYQTISSGTTNDPHQQLGPVTYDHEPLYESGEYTDGGNAPQQQVHYVQSSGHNTHQEQSAAAPPPQQYIQYIPYISPAP